ncbi:MAG TPA: pyridoxal 5'-phosphate synthase glutaminase subunit PdxT [Methanosarcinales archaeon]|nr:pyridoxal 5'-phosphate synthase glutaminase subunit PdxT [Methanosarcinales archaeon]
MKIGVIAIQGNVAEHNDALKRTLDERSEPGEIVLIRHSGLVPDCDAIVLPGGESTTLARLIWKEGIATEIRDAAMSGVPVLGTCAGLVLLAKHGDGGVARTKQRLLGIMDIEIKRNAFGRQYDSFEASIDISGIGEAFPAVFIRAPAIVRCGSEVSALARIGDYVVAAQQGGVLALAFHPEMVPDTRVHQYFMGMI